MRVTAELQPGSTEERARQSIVEPRLPQALRRRNPTPLGGGSLTLLYGRCFSRIHVGERKKTPALIQIDRRGSSPVVAARKISRACARLGRGDLIELLTSDMAAVAAALFWCEAEGGRVRIESAARVYVLELAPDNGETGPCTQLHAPPYEHAAPSRVTRTVKPRQNNLLESQMTPGTPGRGG